MSPPDRTEPRYTLSVGQAILWMLVYLLGYLVACWEFLL